MMHILGILAAGGVAVAILFVVPLLLAVPAIVAAWLGHRRDVRRRASVAPTVRSITPTVRTVDELPTATPRDLRLAA